ncbi:MAG: hypothetical protein QM681_02145 [Novosphingobium sp.]
MAMHETDAINAVLKSRKMHHPRYDGAIRSHYGPRNSPSQLDRKCYCDPISNIGRRSASNVDPYDSRTPYELDIYDRADGVLTVTLGRRWDQGSGE